MVFAVLSRTASYLQKLFTYFSIMSSGKGNSKRGASNPAQDDIFGAGNKRAKFIEVVQKKKKKDTSGASPLPSLGLGLVKGKNAQSIKIEPLTSANYVPGCLALGVVLSLTETSATLSLPGGCIGTLDYAEVSDIIHKNVVDGKKVSL